MPLVQKLSTLEEEAIKNLRNRMIADIAPNLYEDTNMFYRFLKARDFSIDNAELMLRNHVKWRKQFRVDEIKTSFQSPEVLRKYFPGTLIGTDKEGCPVKYYPVGNMDGKGIVKSIKFPDVIRYIIYMVEQEITIIEEESESRGKNVPGTVAILDMKNLTFSAVTNKKIGEAAVYLMTMYQDNYPERLKAIYVINVSSYFFLVFKVLKNFMASSILKKITFCTDNEEKMVLPNIIDDDVLPAFLGGKRTDLDGDVTCRNIICFCGKVPREYYLSKGQTKNLLSLQANAKKLTVGRQSSAEIEVEVDEEGSMVEWEFEAKSGRDVIFGIVLRLTGLPDTVVEPLLKLDMDDGVEAGTYKCDQSGKYVLVFDNSYSWFRSKEIYYIVKVTPPSEYKIRSPLQE